ncbi:glycosyltransferase family 2 protein [Gelidibacter sp. F2691]|nr:glycosyltransferase family 2 protein [Gelidibacter sp. F2691]
MSDLKVSIIIPCYNAKAYIKDTLNSVYNQNYSNTEIIVIDDYSTDGSYEYVESIKNDTVILKRNERKGACAARNYGFELASGDYIQYLDADDILGVTKLDAQLKLVSKYGRNFVYSGEWIRFIEVINEMDTNIQIINKDYDKPCEWLNESWSGHGVGQTSIWLTHRSLIEKAGPWNENLLINQDGEFFSRVLLNASGIKYSANSRVYYRSGNLNSISQSKKLSKSKSESLLHSYCLYKKTSEKFNVLEELKNGLGNNFLHFIYEFHDLYPDLVLEATSQFYNLGHKKMWPVGGDKFRTIAKLIGFKNALLIKGKLKTL